MIIVNAVCTCGAVFKREFRTLEEVFYFANHQKDLEIGHCDKCIEENNAAMEAAISKEPPEPFFDNPWDV